MTNPNPSSETGSQSFLERWGYAAVVTLLGLLALELVVLTPLVHYGVDLTPVVAWARTTLGVEVPLGAGQPSWPMALGIAYGITRGLKPVQLGAAAVLTPVVGRYVGARKD